MQGTAFYVPLCFSLNEIMCIDSPKKKRLDQAFHLTFKDNQLPPNILLKADSGIGNKKNFVFLAFISTFNHRKNIYILLFGQAVQCQYVYSHTG